MNEKDKKAFVSYMRENMPFSYYQSYQCQELLTWQSACEYKQKEIDILHRTIGDYASGDCDVMKINRRLEKQIEIKQKEIDKLSEGLDHYIEEASIYANASKQHFKEVQKLKREIEILRQYGNKDCTAMADEVLENE